MNAKGLEKSSFHAEDIPKQILNGFQLDTPSTNTPIDAESAARAYLDLAFGSASAPNFNKPDLKDGSRLEFQLKGIEEQAITGNKTVKFRQRINNISVYGSQIIVELDNNHNFISLNSNMSEAESFDSLASISPKAAEEIVLQTYQLKSIPKDAIPLLYYFYHGNDQKWILVYVFKDIMLPDSKLHEPGDDSHHHLPTVVDLIIDATKGEIIKVLPRMACIGNDEIEANDELGFPRRFGVIRKPGDIFSLIDEKLGVKTFDFGFQSIFFRRQSLPGALIETPPFFSPASISAHANACRVAAFFKFILKRNGVDNKGMPYISSINCIERGNGREWNNAAWYYGQMVYGQKQTQNGLRSYASALDIVAHEVTHGITNSTSRLEYLGESGALNESYSDIFGIIISNWLKPGIRTWDWKLGEDLSMQHLPIRDISNPGKHDQPEHMDNYRKLPENERNDWGGVHINSGIHNKAAYHLITSKDKQGKFLFSKTEIAQLFYLALIRLAPQDGFSDSMDALILSAKSLLGNIQGNKPEKLKAIETAFQKTGIK